MSSFALLRIGHNNDHLNYCGSLAVIAIIRLANRNRREEKTPLPLLMIWLGKPSKISNF